MYHPSLSRTLAGVLAPALGSTVTVVRTRRATYRPNPRRSPVSTASKVVVTSAPCPSGTGRPRATCSDQSCTTDTA